MRRWKWAREDKNTLSSCVHFHVRSMMSRFERYNVSITNREREKKKRILIAAKSPEQGPASRKRSNYSVSQNNDDNFFFFLKSNKDIL